MIAETHKKAKIVLCKDSFPWQSHSDNLNIQFKDLNDAFNDRRNSQKLKFISSVELYHGKITLIN